MNHAEKAQKLLDLADGKNSQNWLHEAGESKTDVLLSALVHAVLALLEERHDED